MRGGDDDRGTWWGSGRAQAARAWRHVRVWREGERGGRVHNLTRGRRQDARGVRNHLRRRVMRTDHVVGGPLGLLGSFEGDVTSRVVVVGIARLLSRVWGSPGSGLAGQAPRLPVVVRAWLSGGRPQELEMLERIVEQFWWEVRVFLAPSRASGENKGKRKLGWIASRDRNATTILVKTVRTLSNNGGL